MSGKQTKRARRDQLEAERRAALEAASRRQSQRPLLIGLAGGAVLLLVAAVGAVLLLGRGGQEASAPAPSAETTPTETQTTAASEPTGLPATPDYHSLLADGERVLLGSHAGIHESEDGGRTWQQVDFDGDAMNLATGKDGNLWAAGHDVFARSTDGGQSWKPLEPSGLPSLDLHAFAADAKSGDLYAVPAGQGLYRSRDQGQSFALVSREGGGAMALAVTATGRILAADMQRGLLLSDDGGKTWRQALGEGLMGLAANPADPKRLIATGQSIYLSTDGGAKWRPALEVGGDGAGPVAWADAKTAYTVAFAGILYKTTDGGLTWKEVS